MSYHSQALSLNQLSAEINLLDPDVTVAVAVTDLDGFGPWNEAHGIETGDAALGSFERALTAGLGSRALVAHVRGDEFAAALPDAWVDRLAIVGTVDVARAQLRSLGSSGADRVALIPAYPDLMSSLSSLAGLL